MQHYCACAVKLCQVTGNGRHIYRLERYASVSLKLILTVFNVSSSNLALRPKVDTNEFALKRNNNGDWYVLLCYAEKCNHTINRDLQNVKSCRS